MLNTQLGLPYGKTAMVLEQGWGLKVSRSGLCQAFQAQKAEPNYQALWSGIVPSQRYRGRNRVEGRGAPVVHVGVQQSADDGVRHPAGTCV